MRVCARATRPGHATRDEDRTRAAAAGAAQGSRLRVRVRFAFARRVSRREVCLFMRSRSSTGLCRGARGAWRGVRRARWAPWPRPQHIPIGEKMLMVGSVGGMRGPMIHRGPLRSALSAMHARKTSSHSRLFPTKRDPRQTLSTRAAVAPPKVHRWQDSFQVNLRDRVDRV